MKTRILFFLSITILLLFTTTTPAEERNFPAGSLIIPMDDFYQPSDDGGILEAYGLAFYLLDHTDDDGMSDIAVYWIINQEKTTIDGSDFEISVADEDALAGAGAVAQLYNHDGTTSTLTYYTDSSNNDNSDNYLGVSYSGAPFIVDAAHAAQAKEIIKQTQWAAVDIHEAKVPFNAPVFREMIGTPPRIALMNNGEDKQTGNAEILESYLRLAGICNNVYDVVTPNEIRDGILMTGNGEHDSIDNDRDGAVDEDGEKGPYDFLWAPHWTGYDGYKDDNNTNDNPDVEDIVLSIREFLTAQKGVLAECASIEVFEHSENGRFLSSKGFGHNGGTNNKDYILYNDVASPFPQVGNFDYVPEGGHLHNWRPFQIGDNYNLTDPPLDTSVYNDTVTRFTIDRFNNVEWDYYVGGYMDGDENKGYVVYLGGHKYASCSAKGTVDPKPNIHTLDFEFGKAIFDRDDSNDAESYTLLVNYTSGDSDYETTITFTQSNFEATAGNPLMVSTTTATIDKNKLKTVTFKNDGDSLLTINTITLSWTGGQVDQALKKIVDNYLDRDLFKDKTGNESGIPLSITNPVVTLTAKNNDTVSCTGNSDCHWSNIAGVRYVLNTLFNIKFLLGSHEFVRSAPIVVHPHLYQGSFEFPEYRGHFRSYSVTTTGTDKSAEQAIMWDTADEIGMDNTRTVYTSIVADDGTLTRKAFTTATVNSLNTDLGISPNDNDTVDEERVINRVRGLRWVVDGTLEAGGKYVEQENKLGGIVHSAPAIVTNNRSRTDTNNRTEIAYVGDYIHGMLHAIDISNGTEKWAYIPNNLLGKLKNDRTDPGNTGADFPAVDASPTVKDVFFDHDNDNTTLKEWRTILVSPQGSGGPYLFALDVTDPDNFTVMWEITKDGGTGGGMGHAYRAAIGQVKWPIKEDDGTISGYKPKEVVYVATGYRNVVNTYGGIHVFAFDLITGGYLWTFSQAYTDAVNDIPGGVTLFDTTGDGFIDRVFVGDMDGRLWELTAVDGNNPYGYDNTASKEIPLWNTGINFPIAASPAVTRYNPVVLIFGTGGTDWALTKDDKQVDVTYSIFAVNATNLQENPTYANGAGTLLWKKILSAGEKVWSSPTVAANQVYVSSSTGTMESADPGDDKSGTSRLYNIDLAPGANQTAVEDNWGTDLSIGKARGSIYVDRDHIYLTTINNKPVQLGDGNHTKPLPRNAALRSWRQR